MTHVAEPPDLKQFQGGAGLPEGHRRIVENLIATYVVAGVDHEHNKQMILHCDATSDYLYSQYTPAPIYQRGGRPRLEAIADSITARFPREEDQIHAMLVWIACNVPHAVNVDPRPADRAISEEQIIESGWGWCNEQARVLVALAQIAGFPARMCFLFHGNGRSEHATTEVFFKNRWVFCDASETCFICGDPDRPFSARELQRDPEARRICDAQYRRARISTLIRHAHGRIDELGDISVNSDAGFFDDFTLCNYLVT